MFLYIYIEYLRCNYSLNAIYCYLCVPTNYHTNRAYYFCWVFLLRQALFEYSVGDSTQYTCGPSLLNDHEKTIMVPITGAPGQYIPPFLSSGARSIFSPIKTELFFFFFKDNQNKNGNKRNRFSKETVLFLEPTREEDGNSLRLREVEVGLAGRWGQSEKALSHSTSQEQVIWRTAEVPNF